MRFTCRTATFFAGIGVLLLSSCLNLKAVSDYAGNSTESLKKFDDLGYSYTQACQEKCTLAQLNKGALQRDDCDCDGEKTADSVTLVLYRAVKGYYEGLAKLSDNQLTSYKFDGLKKALKEGDFGGVKLNKDHVDAYAKIGSILTRAATDHYRKRKLSKYIAAANEPVKVLLGALVFNLSESLPQRLETQRQRAEGYYFDLLRDAGASAYEKKKIIEEYNALLHANALRKKQLAAYAKGLKALSEGHQQLFENRNRLRAKQVRELLSGYASDIQDIIDEIGKLKKQD